MTKKFSDAVRRATIDLNQAGEYEDNYKKKEATENIEKVIQQLKKMLEELK